MLTNIYRITYSTQDPKHDHDLCVHKVEWPSGLSNLEMAILEDRFWERRIITDEELPTYLPRLYVNAQDKPCDLVGGTGYFIVSQKFLDVLNQDYADKIQAIPAPFIDEATGKNHPGYYLINILHAIDCMDYNTLDVSMAYSNLRNAYYRTVRVKNLDLRLIHDNAGIFCLPMYAPRVFYLTPPLVDQLKAANLWGVSYFETPTISV